MNNKKQDFIRALKDALEDAKTLKETDKVIVCIVQFMEKENRYHVDTHAYRK